MASSTSTVLLAGPHHGLVEGIRSLLATEFDAVVMVSDDLSLCESAARLQPALVVVDLALALGDICGLIGRLRAASPESKVIFLSTYDDPTVARAVLEAGADGLVSKRAIGSDLLAAVDDVRAGKRYFPNANPA